MNSTEPLVLALIGATALRVFAPDVVRGLRRLLGAGVRVGAAELSAHRPPHGHTVVQREVAVTGSDGPAEVPWGSS
ncbi:hypothetical protein OG898_28240 [Streptomyces sp. NBC_00193]|uniref:hypothetical protein n=1 Tax=Streptomyces TaxID=1883 RepID=UPI00224CDD8C|nr:MULTISPECIES: hypothetical protein [unclassified Streptomyces]MCX5129474.1 hypothetical protein [Streptomyces sp. NBC_00347]MCX5300326.1 hypothetical protein [Streptomyces sp. NBC_00193]